MPSDTHTSRETALYSLRSLFVSIYIIASLIFVYGYRFPSDNHNDELPPILAMLHPDLFRSDYVVGEMQHFTPRTYYMYLIYALTRCGLSVPGAHFLLYVVTLASFIFGLQGIARRVCRSEIAASVLVFWGLVVSAGTIGGASGPLAFFSDTPTPALYALGLSIWGVFFSLRRSWPLAYAFFGGACLMQFLVGLLPALLLSPLLVRDAVQTRRVAPAMLSLLCLGLGAGLVYVPMLLQGTTSGGILSDRAFVQLYARIRNPHHLVPSAWAKTQWAEFLLFYAGGVLCIKQAKSLQPALRFGLIAVIGLALGSLLLNILFVEIFPLAVVAKLQFARTTPFAELAILIGLAALFDEHFRRHNWAVAVPLVVIPVSHYPGLLLCIFAGALRRLEVLAPHLRTRADLAILALVVVGLYPWVSPAPRFVDAILRGPIMLLILCTPYLLERLLRSARPVTLAAGSLACLSVGLLAGGLMGLLPPRLERLFESRVALYRVGDDEVTRLAQRFRDESDTDTLVLVPPSVPHFKLHSQRAVVVDFKCYPLTDQGLIEWAKRMEAVLGIPLRPGVEFRKSDAIFSSRPAPALVEVAQRYHAQYILSSDLWHPDMPGEEVDREGSWVIWRLSGGSALGDPTHHSH
jgi:hypothetical protein